MSADQRSTRPDAAPDQLRNRLAKLVVDCAKESNARLRPRRWDPGVRPRGGQRSNGWKPAALLLGVPFQLLQRVVRGENVTTKTVARLTQALAMLEYRIGVPQ